MRNAPQRLAKLDQQYIWHPFTQMKDWFGSDPIVIVRGKGAQLWDANNREYLDANSSIWTNLHGHNHPVLNRAIRQQLRKIAHSSALGLANEPASYFAQALIEAARPPVGSTQPELEKVFFSDDGSTAIEVGLKLSYEFWRRNGVNAPRFLSLEGAYHGDTVGAASLGHIDLFHKAYGGLLFSAEKVMAPYCYRCPFNRATPERADARTYRKCQWECVREVEKKFARSNREGRRLTAFVLEPLIQGAAGMIPQPEGWLQRVAQIARAWKAHLITDEVLTAFHRAGGSLLASGDEGVVPDLAALAKGLSGGCMPLAATLTTQSIFDAFLGEYEDFKTFFHGHSYTANQLGCAAGRASLTLLGSGRSSRMRTDLAKALSQELQQLWSLPHVGDIRQVGRIVGIELVRHWPTREPFDLRERAGTRVCEALARRGVLTRPIGNVLVIMPPYCTTRSQVTRIVEATYDSIAESFGAKPANPRPGRVSKK